MNANGPSDIPCKYKVKRGYPDGRNRCYALKAVAGHEAARPLFLGKTGPMHLRILIVDDNAGIRFAIREMLTNSSDWTIVGEASDGRDAVKKAADLKPDVILMDVSMPNLDGLAATRIIREATPAPEVIILSQDPASIYQNAAVKAGACGYVEKTEIGKMLFPTIEAAARHDRLSPKHPLC
jgi:DNA-binding NarL/FixJ family response regulator